MSKAPPIRSRFLTDGLRTLIYIVYFLLRQDSIESPPLLDDKMLAKGFAIFDVS